LCPHQALLLDVLQGSFQKIHLHGLLADLPLQFATRLFGALLAHAAEGTVTVLPQFLPLAWPDEPFE